MPPANAGDMRQHSPPAGQTTATATTTTGTATPPPPSSISQALSQALESPVTQDVYHLAATLTTQHDDAARYATTLRSLRANLDEHAQALTHMGARLHQHDASLSPHQSRLERARDRDRDRADRLRRVMHRLGRSHDHGSTAYGDRVPSRNSLYDWSPAHDAAAADTAADEAELEGILRELRREQPNTHPEILRVLGRSQLDAERERSRAAVSRLLASSQPSHSADSSLRSAALLQSVRRNPRFSARTREPMPRPAAGRDAASSSATPRDWRDGRDGRDGYGASEATRAATQRPTSTDQARDRDVLRYLHRERASSSPPSTPPMLPKTIDYLSHIRHSSSVDDSLHYAMDAGFFTKHYSCADHHDFVLDPSTIPPPAETSWLAPGAVLSGCQHATTVTSTVTTAGPGTSTALHRFANSSRWDTLSYSSPTSRNAHTSGPDVVTSHSPQQDRWPVKVTIHSVDYDHMVLSATMEAYNVPSHPHSYQSLFNSSTDGTPLQTFTRTSSITTYLEGEILDFNTHTLLTESFKSTAANDATYWRKLPPFQHFTDEELVRNLTSKTWFDNVLSKEWILMRWKERCFVKSLNHSTADPVQPPSSTTIPPDRSRENIPPSQHTWGASDAEHTSFDDSGCGLTISGFYYVCLRRGDGRVEGLYYDPQSSPYQCLKLESVRGGVFPAWGFR